MSALAPLVVNARLIAQRPGRYYADSENNLNGLSIPFRA